MGPMLVQEKCEESSPEKEGAAETTCDGTDCNPSIPIPLHHWVEEGEKIVRQVKLKKKGELRKGVFKI